MSRSLSPDVLTVSVLSMIQKEQRDCSVPYQFFLHLGKTYLWISSPGFPHIVASLFMEIVGKIHGLPRILVSDHDPLFISKFWQELFRRSGTQLRMSSAYHPQSDGQTKVLNRVIEQCLHAFIHRRLRECMGQVSSLGGVVS